MCFKLSSTAGDESGPVRQQWICLSCVLTEFIIIIVIISPDLKLTPSETRRIHVNIFLQASAWQGELFTSLVETLMEERRCFVWLCDAAKEARGQNEPAFYCRTKLECENIIHLGLKKLKNPNHIVFQKFHFRLILHILLYQRWSLSRAFTAASAEKNQTKCTNNIE